MKMAIVGSGIAGLYAAHYLSKRHQVTVYEANSTPGGHTDTHNIVLGTGLMRLIPALLSSTNIIIIIFAGSSVTWAWLRSRPT